MSPLRTPSEAEQRLREMPVIRTTVGKSADGKYVITRTTITYIKPVAYYEAMLASTSACWNLQEVGL